MTTRQHGYGRTRQLVRVNNATIHTKVTAKVTAKVAAKVTSKVTSTGVLRAAH